MRTMVSTAGGGLGPATCPDELGPGAQAGPWIVERELGRGGMGAVYAVVHEGIGKRAALKIVHRRLLGPGFNPDRMLLEAKVVNQVAHPGIVDIFETGSLADDRPYIVMERLDGRALSVRADEGVIPHALALGILIQVCDALIAAHAAGIVHRDLKLDNVFLADNPEDPAQPKVKLLDWGIAKVINASVKHTIDGQLVGTPQYLAPEQARGQTVSPKTDVYSLGVMAYELFTDVLPFDAETAAELMTMHLRATPQPPRELSPDIPSRLEGLILAMLQKAPEARPSAREVMAELEAIRSEVLAAQRPRSRTRPGAEISVPLVGFRPRHASGGHRVTRATTHPGEVAVAAPRRRWHVLAGVAAAAIVALTFGFTAGGSPAPKAAIASPLAPTPTESAEVDSITSAAPIVEPAATITPAATTATPAAMPASAAPAPRMTTKHRAKPTKGRRAIKREAVDPNGTLDAY